MPKKYTRTYVLEGKDARKERLQAIAEQHPDNIDSYMEKKRVEAGICSKIIQEAIVNRVAKRDDYLNYCERLRLCYIIYRQTIWHNGHRSREEEITKARNSYRTTRDKWVRAFENARAVNAIPDDDIYVDEFENLATQYPII
jgi:hypothetical protein